MGSDRLLVVLLLAACTDPGRKPDSADSDADSRSTLDSRRDSVRDSTPTESSYDSPLTEPCPDQARYYRDVDGDGYGDEDAVLCEWVSGWVAEGGDCDDTDAAVNPGADEILDNDVDEDCDGIPACGGGRIFEGEVVFSGDTVEADLAAFCEDWDIVDGWLEIRDAPTLTSLEALSCVCYVDALRAGSGCPSLASVRGLEHITQTDVLDLTLTGAADLTGLDALESAGGLAVSGAASLRGLDQLRYVRSWLDLSGTFSDLSGLGELRWMDGGNGPSYFWVDAPNLTSFEGLDSLERVSIDVHIDTHGNVPTAGFARLQEVDGDLSLRYAPNARGYESLRSVRHLRAGDPTGVPMVENLDGLGGLEEVTEALSVSDSALRNVDGLSGLNWLPDTWIMRTAQLTRLDGLLNVTEVDGDLQIYDNQALESLEGLYQVQHITGGLIIEDNPNLPDAEVEALIRHIGEGNIGYLSIGMNGG